MVLLNLISGLKRELILLSIYANILLSSFNFQPKSKKTGANSSQKKTSCPSPHKTNPHPSANKSTKKTDMNYLGLPTNQKDIFVNSGPAEKIPTRRFFPPQRPKQNPRKIIKNWTENYRQKL